MTPALPPRAADTSAERPWPVRLLSMRVGEYVEKMSVVWVEGQVVQLNRRPGSTMAFLTLRDTDVDLSFSVAVRTTTLNAMPALRPGDRVVTQVKPSFYGQRGSLSLDARQIRPVGIGELLARIESLRRTLAAEGVFDADRKRPLPFLPRRVGLITGRAGAAEKDVVTNARRRWPTVSFEIRQVAVQGPTAVTEVIEALAALGAVRQVDVVVIARGGGSVEDLLPFSNEALIRAVAATTVPVVSAIGHDADVPLLDFVADARASTPTHAASLIVPDADAEHTAVFGGRDRARRAIVGRLRRERGRLEALASRPVLTEPGAALRVHRREISVIRHGLSTGMTGRLSRDRMHVEHLRTQVRLLSPGATLARGYAIVSHTDGRIVRARNEVSDKEPLAVRVAGGVFDVRVTGGPDG